MKNHWLKKKIGIIRYTNMMMCQEEVVLPYSFYINSSSSDCFRVSKELDSNKDVLIWKNLELIEVNGVEYQLKYSPAYSVVKKDYVFTVKI